MYNKLFITFPKEAMSRLENYWRALKPKVIEFKPHNDKLSIQANLQMPWVTGVADAVFTKKDGIYDEVNLWEIKASISPEWKDDALTQAILYSLMTGKAWSRITLINPFRNEKASYHFNSRSIMSLRDKVYKDALTWNLNCYLAKTYNSRNIKTLDVNNIYFAHLNYVEKECCICLEKKKVAMVEPCKHQMCFGCAEKVKDCPLCREHITKLHTPKPVQLTIVDMQSPAKAFVRMNKYFKTEVPERDLCKIEKLSRESQEEYSDDWIVKQKKDIWLSGDVKEGCDNIRELIQIDDFEKHYDYKSNPEIKYSLNFDDGLVKCFCHISALSDTYKFL